MPGRLLRSDNLQTLTPADIELLLGLGLTDVVDLRSDYERASEGPGPLTRTGVRQHELSLFREWQPGVGEDKPDVRPEVLPEEALPWVDLEPSADLGDEVASVYFSYVVDRPDSILAALRAVAYAPGATLVHCAAGQGPDGNRGLPGADPGRGRARCGGGRLRRQLGAGGRGGGPADGLADLRREPPRPTDRVPPQPPRGHDHLPRPHRPELRRGGARCWPGSAGRTRTRSSSGPSCATDPLASGPQARPPRARAVGRSAAASRAGRRGCGRR